MSREAPPASKTIDVIVVASRDAEATRRCVDSVLAGRGELPFEIVMAGASLRDAMALHPDRDVALVSGDCMVPRGWLERLARCAAGARVASATPFSNAGGLFAYPRIGERNALPGGHTLESLDAVFAAENRGRAIEVPAGGEPCVYVTRAALSAVGTFAGVPEFCRAATAAGFTHRLCGELFVRHEPAVTPPAQATDEDHRDFLERDPARPLRRRVDLARLRASPRPRILLVTHNWGGGVQRHVDDVARLLAPDCEVLRLRPEGTGLVEIAWLREGEELAAWIEASEWESGVALLRSLGLARIQFHHVHELPREVLDLPAALGVAYDVTLHDHFAICPRYNLWAATGERCRELEGGGPCDRCLSSGPAQWGLDVEGWRALFHGLLRGAARVIAPSEDVAARIARYFPDIAPLVRGHPERPVVAAPVAKVALIGAVSELKGARVLEACVADAQARGLPLHFHVIGHVDRPMKSWPEAPLTIGGSYREELLGRELALARPDVVLFLSQFPETYSYTLSAALMTGLPIVATRMGALPERLRGHPRHLLVPADAPAAAINDALLAAIAETSARAAAVAGS